LIEYGYKEKGIANLKRTVKFLEEYKWSSYLDYLGKENFPSVSKRNFLLEVMEGAIGCKNFVEDWLKYKKSVNDIIME
jgi:putative transposase